MTNNDEIFKEINSELKTNVKMGNGVPVQAKGKGTITVETKIGSRNIHDVLLVPDLAQNLLSVGQMVERGYALHFEDLACKVYDPQRREIGRVKMERNRSFPLIFPNTNTAFKTEVVADSWLWHRRLGHLNFQSLKKLQQKQMVYGLPPIHEIGRAHV